MSMEVKRRRLGEGKLKRQAIKTYCNIHCCGFLSDLTNIIRSEHPFVEHFLEHYRIAIHCAC